MMNYQNIHRNIRRGILVAGTMAIVTMGTVTNVSADQPKKSLVKATIAIEQAMVIAAPEGKGVVTSAFSEYFEDKPIYVIVVEADGKMSEKMINGTTGDIMGEISVSSKNPKIMDHLVNYVFDEEDGFDEEDDDDESMDEGEHAVKKTG